MPSRVTYSSLRLVEARHLLLRPALITEMLRAELAIFGPKTLPQGVSQLVCWL